MEWPKKKKKKKEFVPGQMGSDGDGRVVAVECQEVAVFAESENMRSYKETPPETVLPSCEPWERLRAWETLRALNPCAGPKAGCQRWCREHEGGLMWQLLSLVLLLPARAIFGNRGTIK